MKRVDPSLARRSGFFVAVALGALSLVLPAPAAAGGFPGGLTEVFGPRFEPAPRAEQPAPPTHSRKALVGWVHRWNRIAIDASGFDHTPLAAGETRVFGEQLGPGRSARAMAIVHIAMHDALNAILGEYQTYTDLDLDARAQSASPKAAVAQAAHDALVALFRSQAASFDDALAADLAALRDGPPEQEGIEVGRQAAAAILERRSDDGSQHAEPGMGDDYQPSDAPGAWQQDPISLIPIALGARWSEVRPFVLASATQFRVGEPPALASPEYTAAFDEVKRLGGDGDVTMTDRTEDQTRIGIYWAYDGTPSLCAPPRLYNQIAVQIADQMGSDAVELARLLALVNVAMADAGIAIWESKYHYAFWRPITGVREADPANGGDPNFHPLGAPASNLTGPNFTPPFPAYPSGHAGFGGALFETLRLFYGTDQIAFTFVSDEFNGVTRDNQGQVRELLPRSFTSLSQAEEENGQSRIYLGIHWSFDKTAGIAQGRAVADWVFEHAFRPVHSKGNAS